MIVKHSVPRVMTDLIRSQFQLPYDGLRPVLESASKQTATAERLKQVVDELMQKYKLLDEAAMKSPVDEGEAE